MRRRILPAFLVAVMVLGTVASGAAIGAVGAQSADGGEVAAVDAGVPFDHNETHNATEDDETADDGNETVDDGNETVDDGNETEGNETDAFGQLVSSFVHSLQQDNDTEGPFGFHVATFVLANNPAADMIPDHAGPPANLTVGPPENKTTGPPANVSQGPPENKTSGPPENATDGGNGDNGPPDDRGNGGPPDDAGPPEDN